MTLESLVNSVACVARVCHVTRVGGREAAFERAAIDEIGQRTAVPQTQRSLCVLAFVQYRDCAVNVAVIVAVQVRMRGRVSVRERVWHWAAPRECQQTGCHCQAELQTEVPRHCQHCHSMPLPPKVQQ